MKDLKLTDEQIVSDVMVTQHIVVGRASSVFEEVSQMMHRAALHEMRFTRGEHVDIYDPRDSPAHALSRANKVALKVNRLSKYDPRR